MSWPSPVPVPPSPCPASLAKAVLFGLAVLSVGTPARAQYDVPYVPTPQPVVDAMLEMAQITGKDYLIDLGSGDGRIVVTAARRFGTTGMGVDLNPVRIQESKANAQAAGVTDKVEFRQQDLFQTDISKATVLTMYLLPDVNLRLRPTILDKLQPGTRVVSHAFDMGDWEPDQTRTVDGKRIMGWVVPAKVQGVWRLDDGTGPRLLTLTQKYQRVTGRIGAEAGGTAAVGVGRLDGRRISLTLTGADGTARDFDGEVEGDRMAGVTADGRRWTAERVEDGDHVSKAGSDMDEDTAADMGD